ncbi:hypothetical protein BDY24DRAFT_444605 [Mrakia frigida]|uniref:uncharacterized protein n=1 Tax=Mrakia frigida TaxID=29902 RepID=UPI003FCBF408
MLLLSFLSLLASFFVVAASPTLTSLSSRSPVELIPSDDIVNWLAPNSGTIIAQCYPVIVTFETDRRPSGVYANFAINSEIRHHVIKEWEERSSNPWDGDQDADITVAWDAVQLSAGSVVWFIVRSEDGSRLLGTGFTVQASNDSSCISSIIFGDPTYNTTMIGSGGITTTVGLLETTSTSTPSPSPSPSSKSNTGAIVGGVIGGLAALGAAGLTAFYFWRRRRRARESGVAKAVEEVDKPDAGPSVHASSDVGHSGADIISPFATPNFSRPISVSSYSSPGISTSQSDRLLTLPEDVVQERDGGLMEEGYQVERVPPTYTDATDAPSQPGSLPTSATRSSFSTK